MEIKKFVEELKNLAPSKESLLNSGFSSDMADEFIQSYACINLGMGNHDYSDFILELLNNYDCSKVEIGLVSFNKKVKNLGDYFLIGDIDEDLLVISKITKEVVVLDHTNHNHIIWHCASNSEKFLSALLCFATFINKRVQNSELINDLEFSEKWAQLCIEEAGGVKYYDFFKMLIGE